MERLERSQLVPAPLERVWDFFLRPENLARITPPWMEFRVGSPVEEMYAGMIITYTVRPLLGLRLTWVTEITQCQAPSFFVDEQRLGPYRFWHHQHRFRPVPGGVEVRDIVHYQLPLGPLGGLVAPLVRRRLAAIFDYRTAAVAELFGGPPAPG